MIGSAVLEDEALNVGNCDDMLRLHAVRSLESFELPFLMLFFMRSEPCRLRISFLFRCSLRQ